ncbi:MAG: class I SAM-dependent methyltransferase [Pseudomonadota bacterium]
MPTARNLPPTHAHGHKMDAVYKNQVSIYDFTRKYYLLGRDRLITDMAVENGNTVLEIACGTGRNLIRTAKRYPGAQYYGVDISSRMLDYADWAVDRAGMADKIALAQADAVTFSPTDTFDRGTYDRIVFSYCLSMIPDWQGALSHAVPMIAPGGSLHIVDFGVMSRLPGWFRAGMHGWLKKFHVTPRDSMASFVPEVAEKHGLTFEVTSLYRDYATLVTIKRPA